MKLDRLVERMDRIKLNKMLGRIAVKQKHKKVKTWKTQKYLVTIKRLA